MMYTNEILGSIYINDRHLRKDVRMKKITNIYNYFLPKSYTSKNFVSNDVVIERSKNITFTNCRFKNITIKHGVKNICFVDCIIDSITLDNATVSELKMTSCAVRNITSVRSSINNSIIYDINTYKISGSYSIHSTTISRVKYAIIMMNDTKILNNRITDVYQLDYNYDTSTFLNCEIWKTYFTHCYFELSYFYNCTIMDNCMYALYLDDSKSADSTIEIPMVCPKEGSFIGYKQVLFTKPYYIGGGMATFKAIAVLEIPEDAKRVSVGGKKCRASKVKVLRIESFFDGEEMDVQCAHSEYTSSEGQTTKYVKGEMVYPDSFDENRFNTCSNGIHFFMSREDAVHYNY